MDFFESFVIIGIDAFYCNLNDSALLNNGNFIGKRQAIFFISNMGGRTNDELGKVELQETQALISIRKDTEDGARALNVVEDEER